MKHIRSDYNRIQDPDGKIPEQEPVFLLRGQDRVAIAAVYYYADVLEVKGGDKNLVSMCREQAHNMAKWLKTIGHDAHAPDCPDDVMEIYLNTKQDARDAEIAVNAEPERKAVEENNHDENGEPERFNDDP